MRGKKKAKLARHFHKLGGRDDTGRDYQRRRGERERERCILVLSSQQSEP